MPSVADEIIPKEKSKSDKTDKKSKKDKTDKTSRSDKKDKIDKKSKKRAVQEEEEPSKKQKLDDPTLLENFKLETCIYNALKETGVDSLFPIQIASFDPVIQGKDVLGRARTGTGKTLAFSLPIVQKLHQSISKSRGRAPKALIMAPTRELAIQVYKQVQVLSTNQLKVTCVYGGVPYDSQYIAFRDGVDIVVGTPGRLIDHIDRGNLKLFNLE
jgi:ATP-dependent RNA helicase DDX21